MDWTKDQTISLGRSAWLRCCCQLISFGVMYSVLAMMPGITIVEYVKGVVWFALESLLVGWLVGRGRFSVVFGCYSCVSVISWASIGSVVLEVLLL